MSGLTELNEQRNVLALAAARAKAGRVEQALQKLVAEVGELRALAHRQGLTIQLLQESLQRTHAALPPDAATALQTHWQTGVRSTLAQLIAESHPAREQRALHGCTQHTVLTWDGYGGMDEVRAFVTTTGGRALAFVLVDPQSPLTDAWDGVTRIGEDAGAVLKPLRDRLTVERDRLRAAGAYAGLEPTEVTAAQHLVDQQPGSLLVPGR
jgi:hypothetical protein